MRRTIRPISAMLAFLLFLRLLTGGLPALADNTVPDTAEVLRQYEARKNRILPVMEAAARKKTNPCIYVTTQDQRAVDSKTDYVPAVINVFNCPEEHRLTATGGIRVRGNSTANDENERPYRIKFDKKQNLLGLHEGRAYKSWVLLRVAWNMASDYMGFRLAEAIFQGEYYSSDCVYVNLYLNGRFKGLYLLCEQNQAAKGRVSVNEPDEGETGTDIGYLVEMDNYASDEHPWFTLPKRAEIRDIAGEKHKISSRNYSIKSDVWTKEQEDYIRRYMEGVFIILYQAAAYNKPMALDDHLRVVPANGMTPLEAVGAVMDLKSLANMLILEELVQNYDVGAGSFFMAVDFSEESIYPKLTFLAPWDFNWGYTEDPDGGYYACTFQKLWTDNWDRSNVWFVLAMKVEGFADLVRDRWRALDESGALEQTADRVLADLEPLQGDMEQDSWKFYQGKTIVDYVKARIRWLRTQWR